MKRFPVLLFALLSCAPLRAQAIIAGVGSAGGLRLFPSDAAVLDMRDVKTSLACIISPVRTELAFDLTFRAGHSVRVPLRDLAGGGNVLTSIFRVTPARNPENPVYFEQKWQVPPIPEDAAGAAALDSVFTVGEGDYQVDWLLRDANERICSGFWKISARSPMKEGQIAAGLPPGAVAEAGSELYVEPAAGRITAGQGLSVTVLLNVAPEIAGGASISQAESEVLISILRGVLRDPRISEISFTAFNLEQRQVLFEQENTRDVDLAGLKKAIGSLTLGTVAVTQLAEKDAEARFLIGLAGGKVARRDSDALIFIGPRTIDEAGVTRDLLKQLGDPPCAVFYLNYMAAQPGNSWRDLIGSAVRHWRGREFGIHTPADFVSAWSKIMSQLGTNSWRASGR